MRKAVLFISLLILSINCFAESSFQQSRFWADMEISAGTSFESLSDNYGICVPKNNMVTKIMLSSGYYICPKVSLGLSVGIASFTNPNLNFIPVYFDIKVKPFPFDLLTGLKLGSQLRFSGDHYFKQGFCAELFCGYPILRKNHFHITPGIEYSYTGYQVQNNTPDYISGCRNALSIKILVGFGGQ